MNQLHQQSKEFLQRKAAELAGFVLVDGMWKPPIEDTIGRCRRRRHLPDFADINECKKWLEPKLRLDWQIGLLFECDKRTICWAETAGAGLKTAGVSPGVCFLYIVLACIAYERRIGRLD